MRAEAALHGIRALDEFSRGDSPIHRLDPRAKVLATVAFVVAIASFDRFAFDAMVPDRKSVV